MLACLVLAIVLPKDLIPGQSMPRDPGVYRYVGSRILAGDLPYRDVWDHKPPAIHYIYAAGLALGGGTIYGVDVLECLAVGLATTLAFHLMRQAFGPWVALVGCVLWLITFQILYGGGNCEVFALPLQLLAITIMVRPGQPSLRRNIALGALLGLALLIKPNTIGIWAAYGLLLIYDGLSLRRPAILPMAAMIAGCLAIVAPVLAFFAASHALMSLYDAVILYNQAYTATDPGQRISAVLSFITLATPLAIPAIIGWALSIRRQPVPAGERSPAGPRARLIRLALLGLPIEALMTALLGNSLRQYYLPWTPTLLILAGVALAAAPAPQQSKASQRPRPGVRIALWGATGALAGVGVWLWTTISPLEAYRSNLLIIPYILEHTAPDAQVLMWGARRRSMRSPAAPRPPGLSTSTRSSPAATRARP